MLIIDKRAPHTDRRLLSAGLAVWVVCVLGLGVFLPRAAAHPLGNYSINQYLLLAGRLRGNRALSVCADRFVTGHTIRSSAIRSVAHCVLQPGACAGIGCHRSSRGFRLRQAGKIHGRRKQTTGGVAGILLGHDNNPRVLGGDLDAAAV